MSGRSQFLAYVIMYVQKDVLYMGGNSLHDHMALLFSTQQNCSNFKSRGHT